MVRNKFDEQLQRLHAEMMAMGGMIERAIRAAGDLLQTRDLDRARDLIGRDDEVDRKEREIEALCLRLILMQQPVARDLRVISAALKMITDMERIGDQAADICEILTMPLEGEQITLPEHLPPMAAETAKMVHKAIEAYVTLDLALAREVMGDDDIVDNLFHQVKIDLMERINSCCQDGLMPGSMQLLDMLMIAKYFERSADHAVNIAEWVEYAVTGEYKGDRLS